MSACSHGGIRRSAETLTCPPRGHSNFAFGANHFPLQRRQTKYQNSVTTDELSSRICSAGSLGGRHPCLIHWSITSRRQRIVPPRFIGSGSRFARRSRRTERADKFNICPKSRIVISADGISDPILDDMSRFQNAFKRACCAINSEKQRNNLCGVRCLTGISLCPRERSAQDEIH